MAITLELPADVEARLTAEAQERGISVGKFVEDFLVRHSPSAPIAEVPVAENVDEWFDAAADLVPPGIPPLSDAAMSRESIYTREDDWNR